MYLLYLCTFMYMLCMYIYFLVCIFIIHSSIHQQRFLYLTILLLIPILHALVAGNIFLLRYVRFHYKQAIQHNIAQHWLTLITHTNNVAFIIYWEKRTRKTYRKERIATQSTMFSSSSLLSLPSYIMNFNTKIYAIFFSTLVLVCVLFLHFRFFVANNNNESRIKLLLRRFVGMQSIESFLYDCVELWKLK